MDSLLRRFRAFVGAIAMFLLSLPAVRAAPASPIPLFGETRQEAPSTLVSVDLEKGDAEIFIGGSWKGELVATGGLALTELGAQAVQSDSPLLFTQTVDLTLSATMYDRWFVEATFLDDYALNTYRTGYMGAEGETVRYVGIGNVGLDFPAFPYVDISGGTPNSFGAYAALGAGALTLHALVRYDAASREEKVYVGRSERTQSDNSPAKRLRGRAFALPDRNLDAVPIVYLEDAKKGTTAGSDGRKYRRAAPSEAAVSAELGLVELPSAPTGRVAVAYMKNGNAQPWTASLGSYAAGTGFLGGTQAVFDDSGQDIDLASYPQPGGGDGVPDDAAIGGAPALIVYEKGAFSPFELSNRYAASSAAAGDAGASLVYASVGTGVGGFDLEESASTSYTISTNQDGETVASGGERYFVLTNALSSDRRSPEFRFPLAAVDPAVYLPGATGRATDIVVRFMSYGSPGAYDIGTDVVAGSVIVTRGGIRDPLATFDPATGVVSLSSSAGAGEVIRISFLKNAQDRRFGSLAAGIGAVYTPSEFFSARSALALRWNVNGEAFTAPDESSPGTIALSGAAAWKRPGFQAELAGALAYEAPDTTGLYRAVGMEGGETALGLAEKASSAAYPPAAPRSVQPDAQGLFEAYFSAGTPSADNAGSLLYRDYAQSDVLGNSTLKSADWTGASIDSSKDGPYPVSVSELGGKTAYVADFSLGDGARDDGSFALWAGFQMKLGGEAEALERAARIIVPYRFYDVAGNAAVRAYLQIGSLADEDGAGESKELVWSGPLGESISGLPSGTSTAWASAAFELSSGDRARLAGARALRIVVRMETPAVEPAVDVVAEGRLLLLPPVFQGSTFRAVIVSGNAVSASADEAAVVSAVDATLAAAFPAEISRLHPDGGEQRVLRVDWSGQSAVAGARAGADGYPAPFPLWAYRRLSFFLRGPKARDSGDAVAVEDLAASTVRLILADNSSALLPGGESLRFLDLSIPVGAFVPGKWARVAVDYSGAETGVSVDGVRVADASVVYRAQQIRSFRSKAGAFGEGRGPQYVAVLVEAPVGTGLADGGFAVDEVCLEDPRGAFGVYASGASAWEREGPLWTVGARTVISDITLEARTELGASGNPFEGMPDTGTGSSAKGSGKATANLIGAKVRAEMSSANTQGTYRWTGGHGIDLPLGPFTVSDAFSDDPEAETISRKIGLAYAGRLSLAASGTAELLSARTTRTWNASAKAAVEDRASAAAAFAVSFVGEEAASLFALPYHRAWNESAVFVVPDDGSGERRRDMDAKIELGLEGGWLDFSGSATGSSAFNAALDARTSAAELRTVFPMRLGASAASLAFVRSYALTGTASLDGAEQVYDDAASFGRVLTSSGPLWSVLPVASLTDGGLARSFADFSDRSLSARFADRIETSLAPPKAPGWTALAFPSYMSFAVGRTLERTLDTTVDSLGTTGSLQFSAINVFGAFGSSPIFRFYKSDELNHSVSASAEFPKSEDTEWSLEFRQSLAFFGFTDSRLSLSNTTRTGTAGLTQGSALSWTVPQGRSLMKSMFRSISGAAAGWKNGPLFTEFAASEPTAERRETFEIAVSAAEDISWTWAAKHESILKAAKKLTWIAFAALGAAGGRTDGERIDTELNLTLGTSLALKF